MGYIIGIIGKKNNELEISIPKTGKWEPTELCTDFTYDLNEEEKPFVHSDMEYMYDGFDFKNNVKLLQKGYSKDEANILLSKIVEEYNSREEGKYYKEDLNAVEELIEILSNEEFENLEEVFFIEIRF